MSGKMRMKLVPSTLWAVPRCSEKTPINPGDCVVVLPSGFFCLFGGNDCDTQVCCGNVH